MNLNSNIELLKNSFVHDYELKDIIVSYERYLIEIHLLSPSGENILIKIPDFHLFKINREEKWGIGKYICSSEVSNYDNKYTIEIELNSGDEILIESIYCN
jgi:hypothetical protein